MGNMTVSLQHNDHDIELSVDYEYQPTFSGPEMDRPIFSDIKILGIRCGSNWSTECFPLPDEMMDEIRQQIFDWPGL